MNDQLANYHSKRDFTRTAEPRGDTTVAPAPHPRFVIQKHAARRLHYDLRLELDGVFKSWAVTRGPSLDPHDKRLAVEVEDHPLEYGDFEGTIPAGQYGGGTVQLWDRGYWSSENKSTPQDALAAGDFKVHLEGRRLHGSWVLVRLKHDRARSKRINWLLIKHRDADARDGDADALLAADASVASGRPMATIAAGKGRRPRPFMTSTAPAADAIWHSHKKADAPDPPPASFAPQLLPLQLARVCEKPPTGDEWVHEIKLDGYRVQLHIRSRRAVILTRSGLDWTNQFRALAHAAQVLPDAVIDGEIVALDDRGASSFSRLQSALSSGDGNALTLFAFDLLCLNGRDLRPESLLARKLQLQQLLENAHLTSADAPIHYVDHVVGDGRRVLESACAMGLEGIVSKLAAAPYKAGRNGGWTKTKCRPGQEVVIGGWSEEQGRLRSLLVGVHQNGELRYAGRVGTGFGQDLAAALLARLKTIAAPVSPFAKTGPPPKDRSVHWARPELVAEIEFAGFTDAGIVRQASFKGLREDKPASEVVREAASTDPPQSSSPRKTAAARSSSAPKRDPAIMGTTISHPDKALWDDDGAGKPITKLDLANYYQEVASWILMHIKGRPCSIIRAPDGIDGEHFFQRHAMAGASGFFDVRSLPGEPKPYLEIDRLEAFPALAQVAAVELHPWNCTPENIELPGRFVFDLDPAPDVPFKAVVAAALEMRDRLDRLGLASFCKSTGGKGLHVVTPLLQNPRKPILWPQAKDFARQICARMAADNPAKYLITMSKAARTGKIYLDYLRNDRIATAVAPLSPRARPGAPVSMPLEWPQVRANLIPSRFTIRSAVRALTKTKPWTDYDRSGGSLGDAMSRLSNM